MRTRWAAVGAAIAVTFGGGIVMVANGATDQTLNLNYDIVTVSRVDAQVFQPIEPCRLLDTRTSNKPGVTPVESYQTGLWNSPIGENTTGSGTQLRYNDITIVYDKDAQGLETSATAETVGFGVAGVDLMGDCQTAMAHEAVAVVLNVTALNASESSYLTIYPWEEMTGTASTDFANRPYVSHLNPQRNAAPLPNAVTVGLNPLPNGSLGSSNFGSRAGLNAFRIFNSDGRTDVFIDVVGYYYIQEVVDGLTYSDYL